MVGCHHEQGENHTCRHNPRIDALIPVGLHHDDKARQASVAGHDLNLTFGVALPDCLRMGVRPMPAVVKDDGVVVREDGPPPMSVTVDQPQDEPGQCVHGVCSDSLLHRLIFTAKGRPGLNTKSMQGTFEPARPGNLGTLEGDARNAQGGRLDAISNVPWDSQLQPSTDRETQRRMLDHREREARFNTLDNAQAALKPKVTPYPNSPDRVFAGTPCYRILIDGVFRFVFIIDLKDNLKGGLYNPAWNGAVRQQSLAYWIVPHFIYRNENDVKTCKDRWKVAYDAHRQAGNAPPDKFRYDSQQATLAAMLGAALPAWYAPGTGYADDSFYTAGRDNINQAPPVKDPLFSGPFYPHANLPRNGPVTAGYLVHPYPYNQPGRLFPQQPDPPDIPPAAPAAGGAAPPAIAPPHASELEALAPTYQGLAGIDWVEIDNNNLEISKDNLRDICEQAEELDYAFALSMQGLRGASLPAVWNCIDPEYDVSDRAPVLAQFVKMYMEKFYTQINAPVGSIVEDVVGEALHLHEEFCKGWVHRHHRTLSAEITAASESLVGVFIDEIQRAFPANVQLTRTHMARYFRRKSEYSGEFANCLYHYMTSLEQMRGNRNASYRAMQTEKVAYITAMKKMAHMLRECFSVIQGDLQGLTSTSIIFDVRFIDWHYISAQLPTHHREFDGYAQNFTLFRTRPGSGRAGRFPPWQQMRV